MKIYMLMLVMIASLASCVPKAAHIQLAQEKEELESEVARLNDTIRKNALIKSELVTLQKEAEAAKEALILEKEEALRRAKTTAEELEALKRTFEQFKVDRRTGMIGGKIPEVALKNGKILINAEITSVTASTVRFSHSAGISAIRLADLSSDLQWQAVWDEAESQEYEARLAKKTKENSQEFKTYMTIQAAMLETQKLEDVEKRVNELNKIIPTLRDRLSDQRSNLNSAFQKLTSQSRSLNRVNWNSAAPEDSEMFFDWQKRPTGVGISQLEGMANAIRTTKDSGAAATAELTRLKELLDGAKK